MIQRKSRVLVPHQTGFFALPVAIFLHCSFVVQFLALRQADFNLDAAFSEMQVERHQRIAGLLDFADQLADFMRVQQ